MRFSYIAVALLVLLLAAGSVASAINLVTNPDFEDWTGTAIADNWTFYRAGTATTDNLSVGSKGTTWTGTLPTQKYHSTAQSQRMDVIYKSKAYSHAGVYQQITVTPNQPVIISAWIAVTHVALADNLNAGWLGVEDGALTVPTWTLFTNAANANWAAPVASNGIWTQRSLTFTPTGNKITIFLDGYHNTGVNNSTKNVIAFFDDVVVTPEPTGLVALLSGLPLIGLAIRRRK